MGSGQKRTLYSMGPRRSCVDAAYMASSPVKEVLPMQWKRLIVLSQCLVACALWICNLQALQSAASAQTSQETQADKTSKHKKSKKAKAEATSPENTAPTVANEKSSKAKKSK